MGAATLNVDGVVQSNIGGAITLVDVGGTDSVLRINSGGSCAPRARSATATTP
jgi:hypothetical protein